MHDTARNEAGYCILITPKGPADIHTTLKKRHIDLWMRRSTGP